MTTPDTTTTAPAIDPIHEGIVLVEEALRDLSAGRMPPRDLAAACMRLLAELGRGEWRFAAYGPLADEVEAAVYSHLRDRTTEARRLWDDPDQID